MKPPTRPNQLRLTDITEHRIDEGKLYLCAIKDVCSNKIVGYSIDSRMKASLVVAAARNVIGQRTIEARSCIPIAGPNSAPTPSCGC